MDKAKKGLGFLGIAVIIAVIVFLAINLKSCGFGLGKGNGSGKENSSSDVTASQTPKKETVTNEEGNIIIEIILVDNRVTVNGTKYATEDKAFEEYIEVNNDDNVIFKLIDQGSILATREWVEDVFKDKGISFVED